MTFPCAASRGTYGTPRAHRAGVCDRASRGPPSTFSSRRPRDLIESAARATELCQTLSLGCGVALAGALEAVRTSDPAIQPQGARWRDVRRGRHQPEDRVDTLCRSAKERTHEPTEHRQ